MSFLEKARELKKEDRYVLEDFVAAFADEILAVVKAAQAYLEAPDDEFDLRDLEVVESDVLRQALNALNKKADAE